MKTHVDFKFSKSFGIHSKGDMLSLNRTFALELQGEKKVGKILGPTLTEADKKIIDEHKSLIEKEVEVQVGDLKAENKALKAENTKLKKVMPNPDNKADKAIGARSTK